MFFLRSLALLLALFLLAACDAAGTVQPPTNVPDVSWRPPTPFPPLQVPTETAEPDQSSGLSHPLVAGSQGDPAKAGQLGRIQQELLQIELDAEKVRGLSPKSDVAEHFVSQEQMRDNILALRDKTYKREDARLDELELWLLRFVSKPSIGLYQLDADLLSEQLLGYYDPEKKELFVLNSQAAGMGPQTDVTLAHEYVHSLQDQHFDLKKLLFKQSRDGDRGLASRALIEGDATLSQLLYADEFLSPEEFKDLTENGYSSPALDRRVPDIVRETLAFPYTKGLEFVKTLYTRGGFATVNAALSDPPSSTEQILHPEKYLATPRDEPLPVGLPPLTDTLGAGWIYRDTGMIGEFELGVLLRVNGAVNPARAVAGWGGGQYDIYEKGSDSLLMLVTRWDTYDEAIEFDAAMHQSMAKLRRIGQLWTDGTRFFTLKSLGDRVIFVGGTNRWAVERAPQAVK